MSLPASLAWWPLARLLVRFRLRAFRNGLRSRGRVPLLAAAVGLMTAFAYVGLFGQAFSVVAATVDFAGQIAALALVTGALAAGGVAARAASSEAVRAGSPENEFMLARPVSLAALVLARGVADAVTDPVGALFLLPVLIAAASVWELGATAWLVAAATSMLVQLAISMLAYAIQLGVVHLVPPARRRAVWVALRLVAALALATLWMLGTWVLRAPASLAHAIAAAGAWLRASPGVLIAAPLAGLARGSLATVGLGLVALALVALASAALARAIARRAGMRGWEEAGAVWAEAGAIPAPRARPLTAASKDLLLVTRDRPQLLALIAMPIIFVGVQIFGAAGWSWSTGSLTRVSCVAYSLALYMATIGPLTHMQAERRAFWILRTVPVPLGRLLAAKARAWATIVGGTAAVTFGVLSLAVPDLSLAARVGTGLLVTASAAGMCFLAVAMASGGADLSDEASTAVGPGTIYAFLLVGGLFNLVLIGTPATRIAGLALYLFATWAYWRAGVARAEICMDAEAVRTRRVRIADGATMLVVYAVGAHAAGAIPVAAGPVAAIVRVGLLLALTGAATVYLARRPPLSRRVAPGWALLAGGALGALLGRAAHAPLSAVAVLVSQLDGGAMAVLLATLAGEELILRGVVQRALEQELALASWRGRLVAAGAATALGLAATVMADRTGVATGEGAGGALALVAALHGTAALAFALTGRVGGAWAARIGVLLVGTYL